MTHHLLTNYLNWNADTFGVWFMWAVAAQISIVTTAIMRALR